MAGLTGARPWSCAGGVTVSRSPSLSRRRPRWNPSYRAPGERGGRGPSACRSGAFAATGGPRRRHKRPTMRVRSSTREKTRRWVQPTGGFLLPRFRISKGRPPDDHVGIHGLPIGGSGGSVTTGGITTIGGEAAADRSAAASARRVRRVDRERVERVRQPAPQQRVRHVRHADPFCVAATKRAVYVPLPSRALVLTVWPAMQVSVNTRLLFWSYSCSAGRPASWSAGR